MSNKTLDDIMFKAGLYLSTVALSVNMLISPISAEAKINPNRYGFHISEQQKESDIRKRPAVYDSLWHTKKKEFYFNGTQLEDKESSIGRIQRTLRWQPLYRAVEKKYGIPQDTLAGMIMQESYGNPVQPNASDDGGLGLVHVQGTTAKLYGLEIYGNSRRDSDKRHGRNIRKMLEECRYDPACVQEYDERAHIIKVLDTAARILKEGYHKYGNWNSAVEYYRAPGRVGKGTCSKYLNGVKWWKACIQNPDKLRKAARDFELRNGYAFKDYINKFHKMSGNWGLATYQKGR